MSFVFAGDALRHIPRLRIASNSANVSGIIDLDADGAFITRYHASCRTAERFFPDRGRQRERSARLCPVDQGARFDAAPLLSSKGSGEPRHISPAQSDGRARSGADGPETKLDQVTGTQPYRAAGWTAPISRRSPAVR